MPDYKVLHVSGSVNLWYVCKTEDGRQVGGHKEFHTQSEAETYRNSQILNDPDIPAWRKAMLRD